MTNLVSIQELVTLALEREGRPVTDQETDAWKRRVRYLEQVGVLQAARGSRRRVRFLDQVKVFKPAREKPRWRLFDAADVALLQVVMRLYRRGVPMWRIKALLAFRGDELRQALAAESKRVLVVDGVRADIVTRREADTRAVDPHDRVSLWDVSRASSTSVCQVRRERPAEWAVPA